MEGVEEEQSLLSAFDEVVGKFQLFILTVLTEHVTAEKLAEYKNLLNRDTILYISAIQDFFDETTEKGRANLMAYEGRDVPHFISLLPVEYQHIDLTKYQEKGFLFASVFLDLLRELKALE